MNINIKIHYICFNHLNHVYVAPSAHLVKGRELGIRVKTEKQVKWDGA
jgi:hypothetical protein